MKINSFFKSVIDSDKAPIVICDLENTVVYMNPASIARSKVDITGKSIKNCHNAESGEKIDRVVAWFKESKDNNIVFTYHSEKENKEWIPGCPLQIKKVLLTLDSGSNTVNAFLSAIPCGNLKINSYTVDLELQDDRREPVGKMEGITKKFTDNSPIPLTDPHAVYATAIITKVIKNPCITPQN